MKKRIAWPAALFLAWMTGAAGSATLGELVAQGAVEPVARYLKEKKPDLKALDEQGRTPLHWAIQNKQAEIALLFLKSGADPKVPDDKGCLPIHTAAQHGVIPVLKRLLDGKMDVDIPDSNGLTPLHHASGSLAISVRVRGSKMSIGLALTPLESRETAAFLLGKGASVTARAKDGSTPLHWASRAGYHETAGLLIAAKADPNAPDEAGRTPLHVTGEILRQGIFQNKDSSAVDLKNTTLGRSRKTVRFLVENGADIRLKDQKGNRPSQTIPAIVVNAAIKKMLKVPEKEAVPSPTAEVVK